MRRLWLAAWPGEPVTGPHPAVQRRPLRAGQLQGVQPGRVDQRQPGQGVGVDAVGLGVARQQPAQVMGLGRADPVHDVAAGREEHRDRQPRRPGRFHHHLQPGARWGLGQRGPLHLRKTVHRRDRPGAAHQAAIAGQHPHGVGAGDPQVDPDQPSVVHPVASLPWWSWPAPAAPMGGAAHGHGPKGAVSDDGTHSCAATGPDLAGSGHFPHPGHPWPAKGGNQTNEARRTSAYLRGRLNATPGTSRDAHATLGPWCRSSTAVPYMRRAMRRGAAWTAECHRGAAWLRPWPESRWQCLPPSSPGCRSPAPASPYPRTAVRDRQRRRAGRECKDACTPSGAGPCPLFGVRSPV